MKKTTHIFLTWSEINDNITTLANNIMRPPNIKTPDIIVKSGCTDEETYDILGTWGIELINLTEPGACKFRDRLGLRHNRDIPNKFLNQGESEHILTLAIPELQASKSQKAHIVYTASKDGIIVMITNTEKTKHSQLYHVTLGYVTTIPIFANTPQEAAEKIINNPLIMDIAEKTMKDNGMNMTVEPDIDS